MFCVYFHEDTNTTVSNLRGEVIIKKALEKGKNYAIWNNNNQDTSKIIRVSIFKDLEDLRNKLNPLVECQID